MATITFDILKYAKKLEAAGVPQAQAEAMADAQKEVFSETLDTTLASKNDVRDIKSELLVIKWMLGLVIAAEVMPLLAKLFL
jgi:hypothetical protein